MSTHADMPQIESACELRSKVFHMRKRIDDKGNVLGPVLPCARISERLAKGAAETGIGNGIPVRRMNAYISVAGPVLAKAGIRIFGCQCTVGEDDYGKRPCRIWIINLDWDVLIAQ